MIKLPLIDEQKKFWYCVKVHPRKERLVERYLKIHNVETYLPVFKYNLYKNSTTVSKNDFLFPGYIFVRINIDEQKRLVSYSPGVSHIVLFNNKYVIVSEKIINLVKNSVNENMNKNPISSLKIGDNIIISNGVMSGHTAKVSLILPKFERIRVLFDLIGTNVEIEIPPEFVEQNHLGVVLV